MTKQLEIIMEKISRKENYINSIVYSLNIYI